MGIYNCEETLQEALDSLYAQTFQDFEIILCDDGSKDRTYELAQENQKQHSNIVLLKNTENLGLNQTLNNCLAVAKGEFIARMDGDDISLPERFEKELAFLKHHPEYAFVSCPMIYFDEKGEFMRGHGDYEPTKVDLINGRTFCHAPSIIKKEVIDQVEGYSVSPYLLRVEDQHLWMKLYNAGYRGFNIGEALYAMRDDRNAIVRRSLKNRRNEAYVKLLMCKSFGMPWYMYLKSVVLPISKLFVPSFIYKPLRKLHHMQN